jgi:XTP/dITP diphosphohydrolase
VLQADGGTRCASITGAWVALHEACDEAGREGPAICRQPAARPGRRYFGRHLQGRRCSISTTRKIPACDTDMNVVMTGAGGMSKCRARPRARRSRAPNWNVLCDLAEAGIRLIAAQKTALGWHEKLVLASNNAKKLKELARLLAPLGFEVIPQGARHSGGRGAALHLCRERPGQGAPCRAAVRPAGAGRRLRAVRAALGGAPGVYSARYAGEPKSDARNNEKLLADLGETCRSRAHFVSVIGAGASADDPQPLIAEGEWHGEILPAPRGEGRFRLRPDVLSCRVRQDGGRTGRATKNACRIAARPCSNCSPRLQALAPWPGHPDFCPAGRRRP